MAKRHSSDAEKLKQFTVKKNEPFARKLAKAI
jgi:hypothetical protein